MTCVQGGKLCLHRNSASYKDTRSCRDACKATGDDDDQDPQRGQRSNAACEVQRQRNDGNGLQGCGPHVVHVLDALIQARAVGGHQGCHHACTAALHMRSTVPESPPARISSQRAYTPKLPA
eukprot:459815-Pelagomonas_calceolata.AAC.1